MTVTVNAPITNAICINLQSLAHEPQTYSRTNERGIVFPDGAESFSTPCGKATAEIKYAR